MITDQVATAPCTDPIQHESAFWGKAQESAIVIEGVNYLGLSSGYYLDTGSSRYRGSCSEDAFDLVMPPTGNCWILFPLAQQAGKGIQMKRQIKIIKRAVLDTTQAEREKLLACNKTEAASPLQLARTIEGWVRIHRQRTCEELVVARSFQNGVLING